MNRMRVIVDGHHSTDVHVQSDVQQGTVCGPHTITSYHNSLQPKLNSLQRTVYSMDQSGVIRITSYFKQAC